MTWLFLPGLHGTSLLFEPVRPFVPAGVDARFADYGSVVARSYEELLPVAFAAVPSGGRFIAIGESFAGPLALLMAARQTAGLAGVVLCESFATAPPLGRMLAPFSVCGFRARAQDWMLRKYLLGPDAPDSILELLHRSIEAASPAALRSRAKLVGSFDIRAELANVKLPVLCLRATEDRLVPRQSAEIVRALIPQAEIRDIDSPHCLLQLHPERAVAEIVAWSANHKLSA